jgi:peptidoglycan LD-endopeptidase CwlK
MRTFLRSKATMKKAIRSIFMVICLLFIAVFMYNLFVKKENIKMPTSLHPVVEERTNQLIQTMADKGITIVITDGFRSVEEQNVLYEQGRTREGSIVTNAKGGGSVHNFGLAVDFALKTQSGEIIWNMELDGNGNGLADWMEVVEVAKELGFEWGGDWIGFEDYPHLQLDFGLSLAELQSGETPPEQEEL